MAKYGSTLAEVKVYINGKDQAKKELEELKAVAKSYSDQMALANEQMLKAAEEMAKAREKINDAAANNGKDSAEYKQAVDEELRAQQAHDEAQKRFKENQTEHKKYQRLIKETEKLNVDLEEAMGRLSEQDIKHLRMLQRQLEAIRNQIDPSKDKDGTFLAYVNNALKQVTETIKNRKGELIEFEDIMSKLTHVDDRSLDDVIKRLKDLIANTDKLDAEKLKKYKDQLAQAESERQRRVGVEAQAIMGGDYTKTIEGTKQAIDLLNKYKETLDTTDTAGIERVQNAIKQMNTELDEFNKKQARETLTTGLQTSGTAEIKQAVDWLTKYQGTLDPISKEWKDVNKLIADGNERMKQLTDKSRMEVMNAQLSKLGVLSKNALAEQKKFWQAMADGAKQGSKELDEYNKKVELITRQEAINTRREGKTLTNTVLKGQFTGTINETKEAIKALEEYKKTLNTTDVNAIKKVNMSIDELTRKTKLADAGIKDAKATLASLAQSAENIGKGNYTGSIAGLEEMRKKLIAIRDTQDKVLNPDERTTLEKALRTVNKQLDVLKGEAVDVQHVLGNLKDTPLWKLEKAAKQLQEEIRECSENAGDFAKKSAELRQVNAQVEKLKKQFKDTDNVILRTAKRLASYILVYAGWNEVWGQIKQLTQANLELSDSLADIQKTTGLTEKQVGRLSDQINAIDTRTAQKELHDLAYEAGKLGISAEEDVMAFVKAGNQLLVALGEDLGGAEAVRQLMKVNAVLGETEELGVEKALLATGSAINEISQTSRASAGPIADMVSRMGAIGSAAGLSMADLIALAGTADSLGQSAEVAATAFNKFIATLTSNPVDVAFALGMDPDQLQRQLDAGNTMQVIQEIFTRMNQMGNMADLAPIMGELGSEGARMTQVLVTMAKSVGELNAQVYTSNKAFSEATSVTNEYNIKNESAAAIVQRMGNNLRESFVQSGFVEWLKDVLQWLYYLPQRIEDNWLALLAWKTVMWEIVMVSGAKFVKFISLEMIGALKSLTNTLRMMAIEQAAAKWGAYANELWKVATMTTKLKYAFQALWAVISKNPFVAAAAAIGVVVAAIQTFAKETSNAAKNTAELETAIQNEQAELGRLRRSIDNANSSNGERAALIKQLNEKYGKYLGFLVTENNYVDQQAYIYDLLNAKLRETVALKMQEKMMDDIAQEHAKDKLDANKDVQSALDVIVGEFDAPEVMDKIYDEITKQVENKQNDVNAIMKASLGDLASDLQKQREEIGKKYADGIIGYDVYSKELEAVKKRQKSLYDLRDGIKDLLDVETNINKDISEVQGIIDRQQKTSEKRSTDVTREHLDEQFESLKPDATLQELQTIQSQTNAYIKQQEASISGLVEKKKTLQGLSYAEQEEYEALTKEIYGTTDAVEALKQAETSSLKPDDERLQRWQQLHAQKQKTVQLSKEEEDQIAAVTAEVKRMEEALKPVNKKLVEMNGINIWGSADAENLAKNSPTQLVAMWDKLEKDASRLSEESFKTIGEFQEKNGKLMATQFWKNFDTREEAVKWYNQQKDAIAAQLKKLGYNTSGHFLTSTSGSGDGASEAEKEARKQYNAVMAALEAHFLKRKQAIQDNYLAEKITGEEMNRQIADNEEAHLRARVELRKKLLGQANTFEQEQYEELAGKNIEQTGEFLRGMGDVVTDGIAKNLEQDEVKVREGMIKIRQAIEEEMLKYDIFGKFENDFAETMDKLQLLTTQLEKDTAAALQGFGDQIGVKMSISDGSSEEDIKKKIKELMLLAEKSYTVNAEGLKEMALGQTEYYTWWGGLNEKQLNDMLVKLRDYYDNVTLLREQYQKRMEREFEGMYKQTGQQKIYEDEKQRLGNIGNSQEQLEGFGVRSDYGAKKTSIGGTFANEYKKLEDKKKFYEQAIKDENDKIDELEERLATLQEGTQEYLNTEKEIEAIKGGNEYIAMTTLITNTELKQNELLAQSQRDLTQVYMDEWTKRAERWGQWGEMFGEYLGEQVMLEKQANDARARGDLETAKKIEQQQKQNKQALIQNLLNKIVDEAALWAKEYALKMMFNSLMMAEDKRRAIEEVSLEGKKTTLSIFLNALTGQSKEHSKGLSGLVTGAIIFAATMALQAFAKSAIANMFPEAASGSTANRKLSTGMLTYAEGNYPVLGNDGKVYDAKYEGAGMKTGIYGGGAHFGIFSEKQPEMIVDGKTTQKLILNYPYIYDAITTIAKNGRLVNAMPTFASGDYPAGMNRIAQVEAVDISGGSNEDMIQMRATMEETREVNRQLLAILSSGRIVAHLDGLETHRQQKKNERFLNRRGIN